MHVYRYSEGLQKQLGSKTKPEPWLHCTYSINDDKKGGKYVIFIWDTRQVIEEGKLERKQLFYKNTKGHYMQVHYGFVGRPARDNGQPLKGAKYNWQFEEDGTVPKLNIKGIKQSGTPYVYTTQPHGRWDVECNINGHHVIFKCESSRFGLVGNLPGHIQCGDATVDDKAHRLAKPGTDRGGFYGEVLSCDVKCSPVGKSQYFVGQKYKVGNFAKNLIAKFVDMMNKEPELFAVAFKNAIK